MSESVVPSRSDLPESDIGGTGTDDYAGTDPMAVEDPDFLLERLGNDCSDMQMYRELTENSIQAIEEAVRRGLISEGTIEWDFDRVFFEDAGVYKLCVTDNGIGMSGDDQVLHINHLAAVGGGKVRGHSDNFGIGAKIAGVTRNHQGLVYISWAPGCSGATSCLWRDPRTGHYGLQRYKDETGRLRSFLEVDDAVKPEIVDSHGTKVTLLGMTQEQDTTEAPGEITARSRWLSKYLNSRYFEFPDNITVKVREDIKSGNPRWRILTGMRRYLKQNSTGSGVVELSTAKAHWWILDDSSPSGKVHDSPINRNLNYIQSAGHVGALFQGELYDTFVGRAAYGPLQDFGVIFGGRRVVIYVAPEQAGVRSNTARTNLRINGEPLPWHQWAAEFRANMPAEITQMMEEVAAGAASDDHRKAIRDRLNVIRDLFRLSRYKRTPAGDVVVDPASATIGGRNGGGTSGGNGSSSASGHSGGRTGNVYAKHRATKGYNATEVNELPDVTIKWVSVANGTRAPGDIEDRAAKYLRDQNLLLINEDFRGVADLITRWEKAYSEVVTGPNMVEVIRDAVKEWHEQSLIETVLGALALDGSPEWTTEQLEKALSPEALTAACLARYHVDLAVKRTLGQRLQPLPKSA